MSLFFWTSIRCFKGAKDRLCTIPFQLETTDFFFSKLASVPLIVCLFFISNLEMYLTLETTPFQQGGESARSRHPGLPCLLCPVSQWIDKYVTPSIIRVFLIDVSGTLLRVCVVLTGNLFFTYYLPKYEEVKCFAYTIPVLSYDSALYNWRKDFFINIFKAEHSSNWIQKIF